MKKRVRILVSLLIISGSLTLTSKSYAESNSLLIGGVLEVGSCVGFGGLGLFALSGANVLASNRFYKLGAKSTMAIVLAVGTGSVSITALGCFVISPLIGNSVQAKEIIENPALAMENENFRFLTEVVGTELAFSSMEQIANGEDPETVVNSLASVLVQNLNTEGSFLDSGSEEDIE